MTYIIGLGKQETQWAHADNIVGTPNPEIQNNKMNLNYLAGSLHWSEGIQWKD